jgi:hypothetical protein
MEEKATIVESVVDHAKAYAESTFELIKLKAVKKGSEVASVIAAYVIVVASVLLFVIIVNIGLAIWLGDLTGKLYYGFFIVAGFYALVALILHLGHKVIFKRPITNMAIRKYIKMNKEKTHLSEVKA